MEKIKIQLKSIGLTSRGNRQLLFSTPLFLSKKQMMKTGPSLSYWDFWSQSLAKWQSSGFPMVQSEILNLHMSSATLLVT